MLHNNHYKQNKKKIINDPVYGFISIGSEFIFDLLEHPYFQRLRRIKQLGLTHYVYPGATHTRFEHALGSMHLISIAIEILRSKGNNISEEESEAVCAAILLHDIGHGPFSHALENSIVDNVKHEDLSLFFMLKMNEYFSGKLSLAIKIFQNDYSKYFLHQLVSSQLDMDRLDYLRRDSFYSGVSEGVISSDRIIKMLNVVDDELVVEQKGIYSIEKFLIARRLMYWQVYLHKAVLASEQMLINILKRAKYLTSMNENCEATPALEYFLKNSIGKNEFFKNAENIADNPIEIFNQLDDCDIIIALKKWTNHQDKVLSSLSKNLLNRSLFRVEIQNEAFSAEAIDSLRFTISKKMNISYEDTSYFVGNETVSNFIYDKQNYTINILEPSGKLIDITRASDLQNLELLSNIVVKHFLYYPKEIS